MTDQKQSTFEGWAILELMGHQREIGYVTTEAYGTAVLFRVDVPDLPEREFVLTAPEWTQESDNVRSWTPAGARVKRAAYPARTRLVAPGALYALNPCTEEAARLALEKSIHRELILISAPQAKALVAAAEQSSLDDDEQQSLYDEESGDEFCRDHGN